MACKTDEIRGVLRSFHGMAAFVEKGKVNTHVDWPLSAHCVDALRAYLCGPAPTLIVDVFFCLTALVLAIAFLGSMAIERLREVRIRVDFASPYNFR